MLITFTLLFGCGESGVANNETPLREASSPETKTDESTSSPGDATPETVTDAPTEVATGTLESEILAAREPVVVLFWAQWCGPCRSLLPVLDRWKETHGDVRFVRKDVDEEPSSAELYDIQTLPTLVRFDNGQETARVVGVLPEDQLASQLGLAAKEPVVVLFWAQWCGPCRSLLPVLDRWKETHGDVRFVRKDVDEEPSSAELYDIQTLPTLVRFDNGQETARVVGVLPEDQLASQLGLAAKEPVEVPEEPGVVPKETTLTPPNSTMSKQYLR